MSFDDNYIVDLSWLKKWVIRPSSFRQLVEEIYNNQKMFEIFVYGISANRLITEEIQFAAKNNNHLVVEIIGHTGSGKSTIGQILALKIQKAFARYGYKRDVIFAWSWSEMNEKIKSLISQIASETDNRREIFERLRGYILIVDEQPKQHGEGSRIEADNFENIITLVRAAQINFILISKNRRANIGHFVLRAIAYNPKKRLNFGIYYTDNMVPQGVFFLRAPEHFPWEEEYIEGKIGKIIDILSSGGLDKPRIEKKEVRIKYEGELTDFEWETEVYRLMKIKWPQYAELWWLSFVEGKSPRQYMSEFMQRTGRKKTWIYEKLKEMNQNKEFLGWIAEVRGKLFESFLKQKYESEGYIVFDEKKNLETFGINADLTLFLEDKPIKVINAKAGASGSAYPPEKFQPEIKLALKLGVKAYLVFYNINTRRIIEKEIDLENPKTISF